MLNGSFFSPLGCRVSSGVGCFRLSVAVAACRDTRTSRAFREWHRGDDEAAAQAHDRREKVRTGETAGASLYPCGITGPGYVLSRSRQAGTATDEKEYAGRKSSGCSHPGLTLTWQRQCRGGAGQWPAASPGGSDGEYRSGDRTTQQPGLCRACVTSQRW